MLVTRAIYNAMIGSHLSFLTSIGCWAMFTTFIGVPKPVIEADVRGCVISVSVRALSEEGRRERESMFLFMSWGFLFLF